MSAPRTTADIMRDLLRIVVERQWQKNALYMGAGDYADGCPDCEACGEVSIARRHKGDCRIFDPDTHRDGCPTAALILEARAFIHAEDPEGEVP